MCCCSTPCSTMLTQSGLCKSVCSSSRRICRPCTMGLWTAQGSNRISIPAFTRCRRASKICFDASACMHTYVCRESDHQTGLCKHMESTGSRIVSDTFYFYGPQYTSNGNVPYHSITLLIWVSFVHAYTCSCNMPYHIIMQLI